MSTKCNVVIMNHEVVGIKSELNAESAENTIIFRHWDGFPYQMEPILKECILGSKWDRKVIEERILNYDDDFRKVESVSDDVVYLYVICIERKSFVTYRLRGTAFYFDGYGYENL